MVIPTPDQQGTELDGSKRDVRFSEAPEEGLSQFAMVTQDSHSKM